MRGTLTGFCMPKVNEFSPERAAPLATARQKAYNRKVMGARQRRVRERKETYVQEERMGAV